MITLCCHTLLASEKRETLNWLEYNVLQLFSEALGMGES
jgi:hypothetical protein